MAAVDFRQVFEASPNPYAMVDRELRFVAVNAAYLAITTRRPDELLGRHLTDVFPLDPADPNNESRRMVLESIDRVFATGAPDALGVISYRILVRRRDGDGEAEESHYWSATHTPIFDDAGEVAFVLQHTVDVTNLRPVQHGEAAGVLQRAAYVSERNDELRRINARLSAMFSQAPVAIGVLSGPGFVVELANARACEIWACSESEVIDRPLFEAVPPVRPCVEAQLRRVRETGAPVIVNEVAVQIVRDGTPVEAWFDVVYQPVIGKAGEVEAVLVVASEVTETVIARRQSEAIRAELEAIFESVPEPLFSGTARGIHRANVAARALFGYGPGDDMPTTIDALLAALSARRADTGEPLAQHETTFARALRGEASQSEALIIQHGTGRERRVFSSAAPIRHAGEIIGAVVTQVDTTERHAAEAEARRLAQVLDATPDFVAIAGLNGRLVFVNRAGLELVGLPSLADALRLRASDFFVKRERGRVHDEAVPAALRDGAWEGEVAFVDHRTGQEIPVSYTLFPLRDARGEPAALAAITRDLRVHKAAEQERARRFEAERNARDEAVRANALKDQFLATVSHELRTPLTAILGWAHMMKLGAAMPDKQQRAFDVIERNARIQARLIDDLLDVSRILAGKLIFEMKELDAAAVVAAAVETVRPMAESKGVRLDIEIDSSAAVIGDAPRLQQVVWNLLANAMKFTPTGGRVGLRMERGPDDLEIAVTDTGIGIDPEFLPHVFERFRQAATGTTATAGGLGLGLSIVKHVVDAHRGSVHAHSDGLGLGARFHVRLPLPPARATEVAPSAFPSTWQPPAALAGMSILVIDDERDTRDYVRTLLEQSKARVTVATSAAEGLARLAEVQPDVVLSDIVMPQEDGYSFVRRMRALDEVEIARTPAIALTAHARAEDRARAMLAGFQNHVAKPIDGGELLAAIATFAPRRLPA